MTVFREKEFDLIKGFGILLIIISHCSVPKPFHDFVYFFHVPIFFIVNGYFFKQRPFFLELLLSIKRLLIPYLFVAVVLLILKALLKECPEMMLKSLLLGTGYDYDFPIFAIGKTLTIGPLWFLLALFWGRIFLTLFLKIKKEVLIVLFVVVGAIFLVNFKNYFFPMPISIIPGFCSMGFMLAGYYMHKYDVLNDEKKNRLVLLFALCWLLCQLSVGNLDVNMCYYKGFYLFDVFGNLFVFWLFFLFSKSIELNNRLAKICHWVGRYSLIVLCVHAIDYNVMFYRWFYIQNNMLSWLQPYSLCVVIALRILFAISGSWLLMKIPFVKKKIFQIVD